MNYWEMLCKLEPQHKQAIKETTIVTVHSFWRNDLYHNHQHIGLGASLRLLQLNITCRHPCNWRSLKVPVKLRYTRDFKAPSTHVFYPTSTEFKEILSFPPFRSILTIEKWVITMVQKIRNSTLLEEGFPVLQLDWSFPSFCPGKVIIHKTCRLPSASCGYVCPPLKYTRDQKSAGVNSGDRKGNEITTTWSSVKVFNRNVLNSRREWCGALHEGENRQRMSFHNVVTQNAKV